MRCADFSPGPLGLLIYFYAGRKQISRDSLWRKGFRSTSHCYSGCGAGEIVGVVFMEAVAIGVDIWIAGGATMGEVLFWTALLLSLTMGLLAPYPVNVLLVRFGVKEGMMNPA